MANIKMSPFDENHAAGWFIVLEAQFEVKNVTQSPEAFHIKTSRNLKKFNPHFTDFLENHTI